MLFAWRPAQRQKLISVEWMHINGAAISAVIAGLTRQSIFFART
jgi:hypothetical protein